ncbi:MAG: MgtC/SapB family protein [Lachnospiraceae bacterium]|nr:MgtC/SapB family protein [Lachnospiraceae bacterium]
MVIKMSQILLEVNIVSTVIRLMLSLVCGGILGFERGRKKRPAGFRTYMLVSMGSAMVMITNQYICTIYQNADPARMGAQVVSGIGFLGAGTIIVTGRNRVKGLTTAAGLWAAACVGLAVGIGYYEGALIGCILIFTVMGLLHNLDDRVMASTKIIELYIEFREISYMSNFMTFLRDKNLNISNLEIIRSNTLDEAGVAVVLTLKLPKKRPHAEIIHELSKEDGIKFLEEV